MEIERKARPGVGGRPHPLTHTQPTQRVGAGRRVLERRGRAASPVEEREQLNARK